MNNYEIEHTMKIREILIKEGESLLKNPIQLPIRFTGNRDVDELASDLDHYPHAFVLGCIADRQVRATIAWNLPKNILDTIGSFKFEALESLPVEKLESLVRSSGHRFPRDIGKAYFNALKKIKREYSSRASLIWSENPSSAEVVYRFLQFDGIGQKIASMATNILARDFKIKMSDYYSIDVSVDRHVGRVFKRLGLVPKEASNEEVIFRARSIYPNFPGILDLPCFDIGQKFCHPGKPKCSECWIKEYCLKKDN